MAESVIVDSAFLVALLRKRDVNRGWALAVAENHPRPWRTCEAALAEVFYLLGRLGIASLVELLRRRAVIIAFSLDAQWEPVVALMQKYSEIPMSLADACLVRMTEIIADPLVLTTDGDFHIYRRHGRQVIPCATPT